MYIITKNKRHIVNLSHVAEMFIGNDGVSIKINFDNGGRYELERYNSPRETETAMEMLCDAVGKVETFRLPTEKEIQAKLVQTHDGIPHHITGKKSKGHGGS